MKQADQGVERVIRFGHHQGMRQIVIVTRRQLHRAIDERYQRL
jgi:hypothetical protein